MVDPSKCMIGCCGFCCDDCPANVENLRSPEDQERAAEAWARYFEVVVPVATVRCRGCRSEDRDGWNYPDRLCSIRACVLDRGLDTCASCPEYPCPRMESRLAAIEQVAERWRGLLEPEEYARFIGPYECCRHLAAVRGLH